jgi:hypothetical protein
VASLQCALALPRTRTSVGQRSGLSALVRRSTVPSCTPLSSSNPISLGAFALGLAESFFLRRYAGLLFALLPDFFSRRSAAEPRAGLSINKVA